MHDPIRVLLLGTGQMGSRIARLVLDRPGLELVGAFGRRAERSGTDLGPAIGLGRRIGLAIETDLADLAERTRPDVAVQATCSRLEDARGEVTALLERSVDVVSIAEEMAWPAAESPEVAASLDALARAHGTTLLGTGVNPGFVLDLLVIALTGVCSDVRSITAKRVNDLSPYGPTVLESQGVGLTPEDFRRGVTEGRVAGHVGFRQSIALVAEAIGWEIERIEETREPIVSTVRRETPFVTVEAGRAAGCLHTAVAYRAGEPVIRLIHPQQVHPELEGVETCDVIEIDGTPPVRLAGSPEIPGGEATAALAVNAIPLVFDAAPGLTSVAHLPVPAALLGDARRRVRSERAVANTWVQVHRTVLPAGERAPQVPEDTQRVPLEMRVKGFLVEPAALGEEAEIETPSGRRVRGTLEEILPAHTHSFGPPIAALSRIGGDARALLRERRGDRQR